MKIKHLHSIPKQALSSIAFFAGFLLFTGCVFDGLETPNGEGTASGQTIQVTIDMPDSTPQTRISFEEKGESVVLEWQEDDSIDLLVVTEKGIQIQQTVIVSPDPKNPKKATFELKLPHESEGEVFDLYGVYGGNGFVFLDNECFASLPSLSQSSGSLLGIQNRKSIVLTFACEKIPRDNPSISVKFKHLGSLFKISLKNKSHDVWDVLVDFTYVALYSREHKINIFAHQQDGVENMLYNVRTGGIKNSTFNPVLPFNIGDDFKESKINPDEDLDLWAWYIPGSEDSHLWPGLSLELEFQKKGIRQNIFKPKREKPTDPGKVFYFRAIFDVGKPEIVWEI